MQVSIIIVNYNTKLLSFHCIQSIYEYTADLDFEIIVVDNASSDHSIEYLESFFPKVRYIHSPTNVGFGLANNLGCLAAKGEFIFLLNSDTLLIENSIKKLFDFYQANEKPLKLGVVGCKLLDIDRRMNSLGDDFPTCKTEIMKMIISIIPLNSFKQLVKSLLKKSLERWGFLSTRQNHFEQDSFQIDYVIGANMFLRKDTFDQFKGFSKDYFMYYEEVDLQKKMSNMGLSNRIFTGTEIIHIEGGSKLNSNNKRLISHQSRYHFLKNHDPKHFIYFRIVQYLYILLSVFHFKFTWKENVKYAKEMISFIYHS
ncbi:glycosyltransferase family 2 protein [Aquirufa sp. ROCK2-A2]